MDFFKQLGIEEVTESAQLEVKKAIGRNGNGELPRDFWSSYSAFANTNGGYILLGIEQHGTHDFKAVGIKEVERVLKSIWDGANNKQLVNANLLSERDVNVLTVHNLQIIKIYVPRAARKKRPVYIGANPLTGTYRRNYEGDYVCDSDTVKRMLADQTEETRDGRILEKFELADLESDSLRTYRQLFASLKPESPWLGLDDLEFLHRIGGAARDRHENLSGLTLAGLLMFGRSETIAEILPNFFIEYQEQSEFISQIRWIDRIIPDGTWSGNLFDFYRKTSKKLFENLKIPFRLDKGIRIEETPIHESIREAFINTIVHADYSGSVPLRIIKKGFHFEFRNPGTMRLPIEEATTGGISDCRNRNLQKMFRLIGVGEQAGSGLPQIFKCWSDKKWPTPKLIEKTDTQECTTLILEINTKVQFEEDSHTEVLIVPGSLQWKKAQKIAYQVRKKTRATRNEIENTIQNITALGYINVENLAQLLGREKASIQNHYLTRMVREKKLTLRYPDKPNSAMQAYSATAPADEKSLESV